ncbi:hypothetical protein ZWY2020_036729 [Hordeum vulgare]|nr:hypothetical protein ZWY2020_036729 [Hordeum vulgare]
MWRAAVSEEAANETSSRDAFRQHRPDGASSAARSGAGLAEVDGRRAATGHGPPSAPWAGPRQPPCDAVRIEVAVDEDDFEIYDPAAFEGSVTREDFVPEEVLAMVTGVVASRSAEEVEHDAKRRRHEVDIDQLLLSAGPRRDRSTMRGRKGARKGNLPSSMSTTTPTRSECTPVMVRPHPASSGELILVLHDPKEVVTALLKGNVDQTASIMALLWHWWNARNKKRVGMEEIDITALLWQTRKTAEEYKDFFEKAKYEKVNQMGGWTKPVEGRLKINVDGSFNKDTLSGGWGYVIRDHEGDVVIVAAGRLNHAMDALHAEAEACTQALYKAQELGIVHAAIETNALLLVSAIKSSSYDLAPYGVLFKEIRAFPSLNFSSFDIVHCPRASNKEQKIKEDYRDEKGHLLFDLNEAWAGN